MIFRRAHSPSTSGPVPTPWLQQIGDDLLLDVTLVPEAERTRIVGVADKRLKISVQANAGAPANEALVRFVVRLLGIVRAQVAIVGGVPVSRRKTLRLAAVGLGRARLRLHPTGRDALPI